MNAIATIALASVAAVRPAPFAAAPTLELVLADDANTARRYVQTRTPGEDMAMLEAEARALQETGVIAAADLAADWQLADPDAFDAEVADLEAGLEHETRCQIEDGAPLVEDDLEEDVEALV